MNKTREIGGGNDYTDAQSLKKKKFDDLKSRFEETKSRPEEQAGMRADALGLKTAEKMDPKSVPANFFYVSVSGVIESGTVSNETYLQCRFELVSGSDWEVVIVMEGQTTGMSQKATTSSNLNKSLVWNFPFDVTYRSTNPSGWPQIVVVVKGPDFFGRSTVRGYGSVHVPTSPGYHEREIYLYMPRPLSLFTSIFGWFRGKIAEYEAPSRTIAKGEGREVTRVDTVGKMLIKFNISEKNMAKFGYS